MNRKSDPIVVLTGGLGNQLFNLAVLLSSFPEVNVKIESRLLSPRQNNLQQPELFSFLLPARVSEIVLLKGKLNYFGRITSYLLRIGIRRRGVEKLPGFPISARIAGAFALSLMGRRLILPLVGKGVGYFKLRGLNSHSFIIGYFQSFHWVSRPSAYEELMSIRPIQLSSDLDLLKKNSDEERPLIVHVRLGDYKLEKQFGIPSNDYFNSAIDELWSCGSHKKIWVFSDEIEEAKKYIDSKYHSNIRWIHEVNNSAAETFEAMRYGYGYVIANSTFSWWGAFLSYSRDARVIAPTPWFAGMPSPIDLIPSTWETRKAF